jgi:hypothetical protein
MEKLTYKQAYDKIIEAYFKDEIQPEDPQFCFCGTLCDNDARWYGCRLDGYHYSSHGYNGVDFVKMEKALCDQTRSLRKRDEGYEDALFDDMSAALDVLKEIHRSKGENVDDLPALKKRGLIKVFEG